MAERLTFKEIKEQLPSRLHPFARAKNIGEHAIAWAGAVPAGLPFDDHAKPARWWVAPTYTLGGLEHLIRLRTVGPTEQELEYVEGRFGSGMDRISEAVETVKNKENNNG